jgi:threonyl-tRNA synthetase
MLPLWLAPTQVRVIPVSADQLEHARKLLASFEGVRVDLDDTNDTLGKKIRRAEKDWVPYVAVVGKKEVASGKVSVRIRATKAQEEMTPNGLRQLVLDYTAGRPSRPLAENVLISARPIFRG